MDSPYERYLDTNYAPTTDEARNIQAIIDESSKEISDLNAQVDTLQKQINILHEKRENLRAFSDRHKALLSPMRKLTRDVLEEIFLACLPIDRNPCMSTTEAPMLLTHICSSWRQIALSTPTLWAKIYIALPILQIGQYADDEDICVEKEKVLAVLKRRETAVNEWLGRSHACPLTMSIYQTYPSFWTSPETVAIVHPINTKLQELHVQFLRNSIIPHHKRWRHFDIFATDDMLCGLLGIGLEAESLQSLETFHVTRRVMYTPVGVGSNLALPYQWKDIVSLMPARITSATLDSFQIRDSDIYSISPHVWGKLTELSLRLGNDTTLPSGIFQLVASILRHSPALVNLKLIIPMNLSLEAADTELQHAEDVVLRYLTTLKISLPVDPISLAFTTLLYLPSINELGIECNNTMRDSDRDQLPRNIIRSLLRATEEFRVLTITTPIWAWCSDILVQLLESTAAVHSLTITAKRMGIDRWPTSNFSPPQPSRHVLNDSLLRALMPTNKSDSEIICPKLEVLVFDNKKTGITETCLKEFAMARKSDERVPTLRRISVYIDQPKETQSLGAGKVSLGSDSTVYFRRKEPAKTRYSPYEGIKDDFVNMPVTHVYDVPMECYNEL